MNLLHEAGISCPYCGETMTILVDRSIEQQTYTEDCQVCCCPILFITQAFPGEALRIEVRREDE